MGDRGCRFVVGSVIRLLMREKGGGEEGCETWARSLPQLVAPLFPRSWICFFDVAFVIPLL